MFKPAPGAAFGKTAFADFVSRGINLEKLVLIDGHSILNRAFYGMPDLTNAEGRHTGAVYGFLNMLFHFLEEEKPDYLAVAFDVHAPTFRHEAYSAYKGTRKEMPAELREQVPLIKEVLTAMGVRIYEQAGLEADDILGTLAKKAEAAGMEVSLFSGDRDLLQIADEKIQVRVPKTIRGQTTIENYHTQDVVDKYGVTPRQFIDVKALMGDSSDNVPGVPGVGEKTATQLIRDYGSVEGVYSHLDEIKKAALKKNLTENKDLAELSLFLVTIKTDCEPELDKEEARLGNLFTKEAFELYTALGFRNFLSKFDADAGKESGEDDAYEVVFERRSFDALKELLGKEEKIALLPVFDKPLPGEEARLIGAAVAWKDGARFIRILEAEKNGVTHEMFAGWMTEVRQSGQTLVTFDVKSQYPFWGIDRNSEFKDGIRLGGVRDLLILAYLCNPLKSDYEPEDVAQEYLQRGRTGRKELLGKSTFAEAIVARQEEVMQYAVRTARDLFDASEPVWERLGALGMKQLYEETELPLSYILYDMQRIGIRIDPAALRTYGDELVGRIEELDRKIHEEAGDPDFNIASPKQLGEILFGKMGMPGGKKTKTGYSTSADVLEKLAPDYPIVSDILEYRGLTKLKSTYADGLTAFIAPDLRIHTTFNQTVTATGRISSNEPNLQNIPMRTELGKRIRKCFLPREGFSFSDADYSQIELRILAHMSADEELIDAYRHSEDIHSITASKVFHTPLAEVTPLQRRNAKAVNFGIVYGISSFGLSQDLSISRKEAADYIDAYFATYPQVKIFLDGLVSGAKEKGYTETAFGRKRPVPELKSGNFMQRQFGERVAMNAPIQGTAADIMKFAMIRVFERLRREGLRSEMILQIHDELLIETAPGEEEAVTRILEEEMKGAADLRVSLEVDVEHGSDWYGTK